MAALSAPLARLSLLHTFPAVPFPSEQLRCQSFKRGTCTLSSSHCTLGELPSSHGTFFRRPPGLPFRRRPLVTVCAATKKADSAAKRARQAEKNRVYNKARRSEMSTRMKKVLVALENLKKQPDPSRDMMQPVEGLIADAFSVIDKAVKVGTIHRNKGANRKSRLSRAKNTVEIQLGWYTPSSATV